MHLLKIIIFTILSLSFTSQLKSQVITNPNYALKSHETLEIKKIESGKDKTVIYLSIENKIPDGYFCADKNIILVYADGTKSLLSSSKGIPVCPDTYKFKSVGEKLSFELTFPPLKSGTESFDLVENCNDNCFSFYGVIMKSDLNKKIDEATALAESNESAAALERFIGIAGAYKGASVPGLLYIDIVKLSKETGNEYKASEWYNKLKSSGIPRLDAYIRHLNSQGISY